MEFLFFSILQERALFVNDPYLSCCGPFLPGLKAQGYPTRFQCLSFIRLEGLPIPSFQTQASFQVMASLAPPFYTVSYK